MIALLALLVAPPPAVVASPHRPVPQSVAARRIEPGTTLEEQLGVAVTDPGVRRFTVRVPDDALALDVRLSCVDADLDLYLSPPEYDAETDLLGASLLEFGVEQVWADRFSRPMIEGGDWGISVEYPWDDPVVKDGRVLTRVDFELSVRILKPRIDGVLRVGERLDARIDEAGGHFRSYRVDVPEGAPALRLDLLRADGDLDLLARRAQPILSLEDTDGRAVMPWGREVLVFPFEPGSALGPGVWYVDVVSRDGKLLGDAEFSLLATLDVAPPPAVLELPTLPVRLERVRPPLASAAAAAVEVLQASGGGSGTLVSASGLVLTAAHVVTDMAEQPLAEVVIGVTLHPERPSLESFRARIVLYDAKLDLALLQIERGLYGQPLPKDYVFPWVPLRDSSDLSLADPLWALGYPITGGSGLRSTLIVTRGVVSGFERLAGRRILKVDCEVTSGNSGGAILDEVGYLVGVTSEVSENGAGQLGFAVPTSAIPVEWLQRIREAAGPARATEPGSER